MPRRLKQLLLVLVLFVSGGVVGAGLATRVIAGRVETAIQHPEQMPERLTERLRRPLRLTAEQQAKMLRILERRQDRVTRIRSNVAPRIDAEFAAARREIAEMLTPEQRERWDKLADTVVRRWLPTSRPAE